MTFIRVSTPKHIQDKMRKIKKIPACIKDEMLKGCKNQGAYMQFHQDVTVYGLWEALLYAEGYEGKGDYTSGTVHAALDAYFNTKAVSKLFKDIYNV